jgi:hypothetical protein
MKLKCVGGPLDGKIFYVEGIVGLTVAIPNYPEKVSFEVPRNIDEAIRATSVKRENYMVDCIHFPTKERMMFLRYAKLSTYQAVNHQFAK